MTELVVGKYEFFPYECSNCKEPTLRDLEELLRSLKNEKRETVRTKARQPRRRDHKTASTENRVVKGNRLSA